LQMKCYFSYKTVVSEYEYGLTLNFQPLKLPNSDFH